MKDKLLKDESDLHGRKSIISRLSDKAKVFDEIIQNKGIIWIVFANLSFGMGNFFVKYFKVLFEEEFDSYSFNLWRTSVLIMIGYGMIKINNQEILKYENVKNKVWFLTRITANFFTLISFILAITYLRVATAQSINSMNPMLVIIFSIFLLKEKFYIRYIIGIIICFSGTLLIVLNDKKYQESNEVDEIHSDTETRDLILGVFFAFVSMVSIALLIISNKILILEKINVYNQVFYIGVSNSFFSLVCCILNMKLNTNLYYMICSMLSGLLYYISLYCFQKGLELIDVAKVTPLSYLSTLVVFIMGVIILGETVFFTDIIGSLLILAFNIYNNYYPLKH